MTPKITLIILQTLCGKIARSISDKLEWGSKIDKANYKKLTSEFGTVIVGSSTYKITPKTAFQGRKNLVLTSDPEKYASDVSDEFIFLKGNPLEIVEYLKTNKIENAALVGGGKVNNAFLKAGCVDEIYLTLGPKIFAEGIPSFGTENLDVDLELLESSPLGPSELLLHYKVVK